MKIIVATRTTSSCGPLVTPLKKSDPSWSQGRTLSPDSRGGTALSLTPPKLSS
ncbi:Hypothetical protein FKW44_022624 [Caligus rogercresseyi]|uniref:Uncharacterized protein n=1 Tax=Caligus rogercresseyi TaxID=217165 RepID=A0A7T8JUJ9_CALRO|nr:Hypothetical protein FKW44_022624 [Caligus rogercresseyi]